MTAPQENAPVWTRAAETLAQVGEELAFVEPGRDIGLLPINSLVMDLEELPRVAAPAALASGLAAVRTCLDRVLDGPGLFTAEAIRFLNEWHAWMSSLLTAWQSGGEPPPVPPGWSPSGAGPAGATAPGPTVAVVAPGASAPQPGDDETSMCLNVEGDPELLREFHGESVELLQNIEQGVLVLEERPGDPDTINSVFRAFHTLKGGAGFLHLDALRDLAHDLESLLDAARRRELSASSEVIDLILAGADALKQIIREIGAQLQGQNPGAPIRVLTQSLRRRVRAMLSGGAAPAPRVGAPVPAPAPPEPAAPPTVAVQSVVSEAAAAVPMPPIAPPQPVPSARAPEEAAATGDGVAGFVKLDTRKLDSLVDLVGELVIAQSMVTQDPDVQRLPSRHLARCLRQLGRITTELQRTAMSLRMVPVRRTFQKTARLVRDLAAQQQKQVQLVVEGEETELDRNIVEELSDPLVHMVRNAVDHGIELPADRVSRGKPALGTIRLTASHQRGGIVIGIQDDGRGLDRDRILAKARERGLVGPEAVPTEAEVLALIFEPGLSTATSVTDLSGRGVGMDVVRRNIDKLRGRIEIQSVPGQGTTFTILLPLTLAIIDGMLVGVGEERYIIPTLAVRESFRPRPGMVTTVHERGEMVSVRGRLTPLLRLGRHLRTPYRAEDPTDGIIVVVESGDAARGLLVDELIGKQEVVIKSLGAAFRRQDLLAGAAILGDGRVGLILDVDTLVRCRTTEN